MIVKMAHTFFLFPRCSNTSLAFIFSWLGVSLVRVKM